MIPDLALSPRRAAYRRMRTTIHTVSEQAHKILYYNMLTSGKLNAHRAEIDRQAEEMFSRLIIRMEDCEGVTEQLNAGNQMEWARQINNIRNRAAEIVYAEIIYSLYVGLKENQRTDF